MTTTKPKAQGSSLPCPCTTTEYLRITTETTLDDYIQRQARHRLQVRLQAAMAAITQENDHAE